MNKRGVNLISDALRFHRLRYLEVRHAIGYAEFYSRSRCAVIHAYDDAGNVIEMPSTLAVSSCSAPVSLNRQAIRQIVGCHYSFGDFHARSSADNGVGINL